MGQIGMDDGIMRGRIMQGEMMEFLAKYADKIGADKGSAR
jgi:hypothetical protein